MKFLGYPEFRSPPDAGNLDGILDGDAWKEIKALAQEKSPGCTFIGLVGSDDKAIIYDKQVIGIEPTSYFIANFPACLRHVIHLGMF